MRREIFAISVLICVLGTHGAQAQSFQGVLTWHNDVGRTGQNLNETTLTPQNVNMGSFGKVFSYPVDGPIYAQPLYVPNVIVPNQGMHNVVYVATENDTVYAFDADGLQTTPLWQVSFIDPANGITTVATTPASGIYPTIGVTATPVIDPGSKTMYLLARTVEQGVFVQRLHALDITTGAEKFGGPTSITATFPSSKGTVKFDPSGMQRSALLLLNGTIYVGWATAAHGWIMAYDAQTLTQTAVLNTTPNSTLGGVWMSGAGLAADSEGYVYAATGDGLFDFNTNGVDDGDSILKLNSSLTIVDYFTPSDQACRKSEDFDLASGGVLVLPPQPGTFPNLVIAAGKGGSPCDLFGSTYASPIYVLNSDALGGYNAFQDTSLQTIAGAPAGYWSSPAYWQGPNATYIYYSGTTSEQKGTGDFLKMYSLSNGQLSGAPIAQSTNLLSDGGTPSISANGSSAGIVWEIARQEPLGVQPPKKRATLYAYDATQVGTMLYSSSQAGTRDQAGIESKFMVPTIANGRVYVPTNAELDVYGLFNGASLNPVVNLSATSLSFNNQPVNSSSPVQSVTLSNSGSATLIISNISVSGDFSFGSTATSCPYSGGSVYPGASCTIDILFNPSMSGTLSGSVTVSDNVSPAQSITLSGSGSISTESLVVGRNDQAFSLSFRAIALGDFDGDGNPDILAISPDNGTVSVLKGNGDGTFSLLSTTSTGNNPATATIADFNSDGKLDTAVANQTDNTIAIVLGNGDGTFAGNAPFTLLQTGNGPVAVVSGDWNADAKQDLAVTNSADGTVSIFLGNGDGTFAAQGPVAVGQNPVAIAVADFNHDGKPDLAVANRSDGTVTILLGNGDGTFSNSQMILSAPDPVALTVADWNGDGWLDIAVLNQTANSISLFNGNGDGTFVANGTYTTGSSPQALLALDLNSDGKVDLAFANSADNTVSVALGNGDGTFQSSINANTDAGPCSMISADFDRDGQPDIASANCQAGNISVLEQEPQLTLSAAAVNLGYQAVGTSGSATEVSLVNTGSANLALTSVGIGGDDSSDFVVTNNCGDFPATILPGAGCTLFVSFSPLATGPRNASVTITNNSQVNAAIVSLSGVGTGPAVSLSSTSVNFGNEVVGTSSGIRSVVLTNSGNAMLGFTSITASSDYSLALTATSCPYSGGNLTQGASCTIDVVFTPSISGTDTGKVNIADNASGPQTVTLNGSGQNQSVFVNPLSGTFGTVVLGSTSPKTKSFTLTNSTNSTLAVTVAITGTNSGDFGQTNNCSSVSPWKTCTTTVTFTPTDINKRSASLTFTYNGPNSPQTASISGTATAISLSPTTLSFGNQSVGTRSAFQTVTVTNRSTTFTAKLGGKTITGANATDFALSSGCKSSLAPGASCTVKVIFTPTATGSRTANLSLSDNAGASPQIVTLAGTGD